MSLALMNYLTEIQFGPGSVAAIPELLERHRIQRPLLVTDGGLVELGLADSLPIKPVAIFSDIPTNPTEASVEAGVGVFREFNCDGIVALGGGSPIDCAKAISLRVTHLEPLETYAVIRGGLSKITADKPPVIAVPTTSGTGSEVGRASLITVASGAKLGLISPHMIPTSAVCDPNLTLNLPPLMTAATGMDAISHCVETFCSPKLNPVADAIALDGLTRAVNAIRGAVNEGRQIEYRTEMMMASLQGGLTFQKGLGMIHSLSHPLGAVPNRHLHHGTLNAIFLPHVLRYNAGTIPEKMDRMAAAVGASRGSILPAVFERLLRDIGLPSRLSELGVDASDLADIPAAAMQDHSTPCNPRQMTESDCRAVLLAAL